jgi:predicted nucleic-acid-binding protein
MIGLDTNVLLRAALNDDAVHSPVARSIVSSLSTDRPGYVSLAVVLEFAWTLRVKVKDPKAVRVAIEFLLANPAITFAHRDIVSAAVLDTRLDFADAIIAAENRKAGCDFTLTFDAGALNDPHFQPAGA